MGGCMIRLPKLPPRMVVECTIECAPVYTVFAESTEDEEALYAYLRRTPLCLFCDDDAELAAEPWAA